MRRLRSALLWCGLLNKRILKQPLYILLLLLIPVLVLGLRVAAPDTQSLLTVGIAAKDPSDQTAQRVLEQLQDRTSDVVRYETCASEEDLRSGIAQGTYHLGFLFPADLQELFDSCSRDPEPSAGALSLLGSMLSQSGSRPLSIRCLTGSDDIAAKLLREHLYGVLYADFNRAVLISFLLSLQEPDGADRAALEAFADQALAASSVRESFFSLEYVSGETITDEALAQHLTAPLRGLLSAVLVLTGLASALLVSEDEKENRFVWVQPKSRSLLHFACILIPLCNAGAAMYLALYLSGTFTTWQQELLRLLLLVFMIAGFSDLMRILLGRSSLFAAVLPLVLCACLFLTPVFFDLNAARSLRMLLPPYLYLQSVHGGAPVRSLVLYAVLAVVGSLTADRALAGKRL